MQARASLHNSLSLVGDDVSVCRQPIKLPFFSVHTFMATRRVLSVWGLTCYANIQDITGLILSCHEIPAKHFGYTS